MKIQELENELNISRANIRFYEKEGLLNPKRKENGYRNYSDDDIAILKKIIIYRKLGISVADIKKIFNGEAELQEAVSQSIENLQKEIENLNGSIKLCKEIQNSNTDNHSFDEENYWKKINSSEANGNKFVDICKDYAEFEKDLFYHISKYFFPVLKYIPKNKKFSLLFIMGIFIFSVIRGVFGVVIWKNESFFNGFLEPFIIFIVISVITLPILLFKDKYPRIAKIYLIILNIIIILAVIAVIALIIFIIVKIISQIQYWR